MLKVAKDEPIQRDPILVLKYREAIKKYKPRGAVDHTKIVTRKNKVSAERRRLREENSYDSLGPARITRNDNYNCKSL